MQPQFLTAAIGGVFYLLHPEVIVGRLFLANATLANPR